MAEYGELQLKSSSPEASHAALSSVISATMSNALLIYFFRRVRKTNPAILQHYIEIIINGIAKQEFVKSKYQLDAGVIIWPMFIAACEAIGQETRRTILGYLRQAGTCGFRVADKVESFIEEFWNRRDGCSGVDFRTVLQDSKLRLQLL